MDKCTTEVHEFVKEGRPGESKSRPCDGAVNYDENRRAYVCQSNSSHVHPGPIAVAAAAPVEEEAAEAPKPNGGTRRR